MESPFPPAGPRWWEAPRAFDACGRVALDKRRFPLVVRSFSALPFLGRPGIVSRDTYGADDSFSPNYC